MLKNTEVTFKETEEMAKGYTAKGYEAEKMFLAMINGNESKRDAFVSEVIRQVEERNRR